MSGEVSISNVYLAAYLYVEGMKWRDIRPSAVRPNIKEFVYGPEANEALSKYLDGRAAIGNLKAFEEALKRVKSMVSSRPPRRREQRPS